MGNEASRPDVPADKVASATIRRMDKVIRKKVRGGVTYNMKLLIRGERGTGKTSLMARLQGQPIPETHIPTREIQTASIQWTMQSHEDTIKCELWDVVDVGIPKEEENEMEDPNAVGRHPIALVDAQSVDIYQNAHCVIFLMDITKYSTLEYVRSQLDHVPVHIPTLVIGTFRDLRKDENGGTPLKRAIFKEDVHTLLYGDHKDHKSATFRRPLEQHYFEASMANCYGLKALHTYLGVPYLHLKVATVKQQLRLLETELANTKHQVEMSIAKQKYSDFVSTIAGVDIRTGRRIASSNLTSEETKENAHEDDLEDLPERDVANAEVPVASPLKIVHDIKPIEPIVKAVEAPVVEKPKAPPPTPPQPQPKPVVERTSWAKNETLEDFQVKTDIDKFYSSDEESEVDSDEDVVVPTGIATAHLHRKKDFLYSDSDDDDVNNAMFQRPMVKNNKTTKARGRLSTKETKRTIEKAPSPKALSPKALSPKAAKPVAVPEPEAIPEKTPSLSPQDTKSESSSSESENADTISNVNTVHEGETHSIDSDKEVESVPHSTPAYIAVPPRSTIDQEEEEEVKDVHKDEVAVETQESHHEDAPSVTREVIVEASDDEVDEKEIVRPQPIVQSYAVDASDDDDDEPWATKSIQFSDDEDEFELPVRESISLEDGKKKPHVDKDDSDDEDEPELPVRESISLEDGKKKPHVDKVDSDDDDFEDCHTGEGNESEVNVLPHQVPQEAITDVLENIQPVESPVAVPSTTQLDFTPDSDSDGVIESKDVVFSDDDSPPLEVKSVEIPVTTAIPLPEAPISGLPSLPIVNITTSATVPVVARSSPVPKQTKTKTTKARRKLIVASSSDEDSPAPVVKPAVLIRPKSPPRDVDEFKVVQKTGSFWSDEDINDPPLAPVQTPKSTLRSAMPSLPSSFSIQSKPTPTPPPVQMNISILAAIEEAKRTAMEMLLEPTTRPSSISTPSPSVSAEVPEKKSRVKVKKGTKPKKAKTKKVMQVLDTLLVLITSVAANNESSCCAKCLAQPTVAGVDAVNWTACSSAKQVCCFDTACHSSNFGVPTFVSSEVTYDGSIASIPSGIYLQLSWPGAMVVKYLTLKKGQAKTAQVTNTSNIATATDNYFAICPLFEGSLYLRAFDSSGCDASLEMLVTVAAGNGTCSNSLPTTPPSVTSVPCDSIRGAITNGVCTCLQDYSDPPSCLKNSAWKQWGQVLTYCAGGASFITAVFGFYRLWKQRHAHQNDNHIIEQSPQTNSDTSPLEKSKEVHHTMTTPAQQLPVTLAPLKNTRDDSKASSSNGSSISEVYHSEDVHIHTGRFSDDRNSREFSL
ncbi:GTP-binding protein Parf [Thraustotheca clavata]|uniref:GTP-binding protein Parf n=1 Tax=Thraustotheca clavata TaxID=74557 RepID=A0A1W0A9Z5_9STRA|nr:GTP-binding protein Parf [Thraustotheca clavata]